MKSNFNLESDFSDDFEKDCEQSSNLNLKKSFDHSCKHKKIESI